VGKAFVERQNDGQTATQEIWNSRAGLRRSA
jgi:hypothetical protein